MEQTWSPTSTAPSPAARPTAAIVAWCVVAAAQIALAFSVTLLVTEGEVPSEGLYEYGTAIGGVFVYAFLLGLTVGIAALGGPLRETLGLRAFRARWFPISLGIVIGVAVLAYLLAEVLGLDAGAEQGILPEEWRPERAGAIMANAFVIVVAAPVVEELFFRGAGVRLLQAFGPVVAIVVPGLAFGLAHGLLIGLLPLAVFGIGLAWVRLRAASVWPCVLAHMLYNGAVLGLGLACLSSPECRPSLGCVL